jgi:hypothetical protein
MTQAQAVGAFQRMWASTDGAVSGRYDPNP